MKGYLKLTSEIFNSANYVFVRLLEYIGTLRRQYFEFYLSENSRELRFKNFLSSVLHYREMFIIKMISC